MRLLLAMSLDPKEIGQRIKAAREQKGWTQLDFSYEAGKSPSTVSRWERGELPPVRGLMRIADILGIPAEQLVEPPVSDGFDSGRLEALLEAQAERVEEVHAVVVSLLELVEPLAEAQRRERPDTTPAPQAK